MLVAGSGNTLQAAQKGPDARRRPPAAREAYSLYGERAAKGADCRASEGSARPSDGLTSDHHADGPLEASLLDLAPRPEQIPLGLPHVCQWHIVPLMAEQSRAPCGEPSPVVDVEKFGLVANQKRVEVLDGGQDARAQLHRRLADRPRGDEGRGAR